MVFILIFLPINRLGPCRASVRAKALLQRVPLRRTVEFPAQRPPGQELRTAADAAQPAGAVPRRGEMKNGEKSHGIPWGWCSYRGKMMGKPMNITRYIGTRMGENDGGGYNGFGGQSWDVIFSWDHVILSDNHHKEYCGYL